MGMDWNITDEMVLYLIKMGRRNCIKYKDGLDRRAYIFKDFVIKIPISVLKLEKDIEKTIRLKKIGVNNEIKVCNKESQSLNEILIYRDYEGIDCYSPKLFKVGSWNGLLFSVWERLDTDFQNYKTVKQVYEDTIKLFHRIQDSNNELLNILSDVHIENIGYDKEGNIKLLDMGCCYDNGALCYGFDENGEFVIYDFLTGTIIDMIEDEG